MIRIKAEKNMTFVGVADAGCGKHKKEIIEKKLLEALADFMLEHTEQMIAAPFRDEIKFQIVKKIREELRGYYGEITDFAGILMIPEEELLFHVRFGRASIFGVNEKEYFQCINKSLEFDLRGSDICEEESMLQLRIGIKNLTCLQKIYLFGGNRDEYIGILQNKGRGGRGCEEYEPSRKLSEWKKKRAWIRKTQCIVTIQ